MSRDIRSYFAPAATSQKKNSEPVISKPKKKRTILSDENEEKSKSPSKRRKVVRKKIISSDSEDDITIVENDKNDFKASKKNRSEKLSKEIPFDELFAKKPITRIEDIKVIQKLQKAESEFHDDDFDIVLKQLDKFHATGIEDTTKDKYSTENANFHSKHSDTAMEIEIDSNKSKKHDTYLKDRHNETNKASKIKIGKTKSFSRNNTRSKVIISSPTKQLQKGKKVNTSMTSSASNEDDAEKQSPNRKKAETVDLFEERIQKKKQHAIMYEKYLQRGGARNPGSKEIPMGAKNCLAGLSFLITGVLDSLERNEAENLIRQYGGRTVNSVSGKLNYIVVGDEPGPAKLATANNLGIKKLSEDELLEMIRIRPEGKAEDIKLVTKRAKTNIKKTLNKSESDKSPSPNKVKTSSGSPKQIKMPSHLPVKTMSSLVPHQASNASDNLQKISTDSDTSTGLQPFVEKYRPKTMKQIIGQQGDKSCAHNLYVWLRDWHKNRQDPKFKNGTGKQTHGQSFKAALLSGSPGVGKTTTVQVICKELGYDLVEFNASDTRNKTLLKEEVSGLLSNTTMKDYITGTKQKITTKHVLLMDEVDGMAGNEDRGGLQELLNLIKSTEVPIVCICNDRFNTRVKTISTHSYDLRFPKLRVEQIRSAMKSLCYKENIKILTEDLDRLIELTNYDIRQVINHLEFLGGQTSHIETTDNKHSNENFKNFKLGPFDVVKMAFNAEKQKKMSLNDKIGLYFHDYNIAPLFVQENYMGVKLSQVSPLQKLQKIANAADSISQGDLVEKVMRSNMIWSLLPLHACFSFVIPGNELSGSLDALVRFPGWFGRNSKAMRFNRLMQELTTHTRLATSANKNALNLDYLVHIRNSIIKPLIDNGADGIEAAINVMGKYHLTREDLDSITEISLWPGISDPTSNLDSKVKAAFTRAYQKNPPMLPYTISSNATAKRRLIRDDDFMVEDDEEEENDDIDSDKMIKAKKPTTTNTSKTAASTSKTAASKRNDEPVKKRRRGRGKGK